IICFCIFKITMYKKHPQLYDLPDETVIWKYLDLFKYMDLIKNKSLFMLQVSLFQDLYEVKGLDRDSIIKILIEETKQAPEPKIVDCILNINENLRKNSFINCWHINNYQSSVMWEAYSNSNGGLAIRSTVGNLKKSITDEKDIFISKVIYNRDIPLTNIYHPIIHKREEFRDEHELRVFYADNIVIDIKKARQNLKGNYPFVKIKINPEILIDSVFFHPLTPKWVADSISGILEQFGQKFIPTISTLYSD